MGTRPDFVAPLSSRAPELLEELRRPSSLREKLVGRTAHDLAVLNDLNAAPEPRTIPLLLEAAFGNSDKVSRAATGIIDAAFAHTPVRVAQYYVDALARPLRPRTLARALAGLRETGQPAHVGLTLGFLDHDKPVVRRAALRTVATLDATR